MRWFWSAVALLGLLPSFAAAQDGPRKPNVVFIVADDLAAYAVGAYGNQQVRTPNLDRLAAQGVRFDRAFCNAPVCTPSRQSFITGRLPHAVGVTQLPTPLPDDAVTLGNWLGDLGYETVDVDELIETGVCIEGARSTVLAKGEAT